MALSRYSPPQQQIHKRIQILSNSGFQFIPAHREIEGNELADLAAKAVHISGDILKIPFPRRDKVRIIKSVVLQKWQDHWYNLVDSTGKGRHLRNIKNQVKFWPWSCHKNRSIETAFAKMRIGHCNTKSYMFRFNLTQSPLCYCGNEENLEHIFIKCPRYARERGSLFRELKSIGVSYTIKNILGGGNFENSTQVNILDLTSKFLINIDVLYRL